MPSAFQQTTLTTPVSVANGGTGDTTLAAHGVLIGEGTSAVAVTGAGTSGQVLTSNGASADPTFQPVASGPPVFASTSMEVVDDFVDGYPGGLSAPGPIGQLNWWVNTFGGGAFPTRAASATNHPGVISFVSTGSGLGASVSQEQGTGVSSTVPMNQVNHTMEFAVKFSQTSSVSCRFGVGNTNYNADSRPSSGYYFELNTGSTANIRCLFSDGGSNTVGASTIVPDTNWHTYKIVVNTGAVSYYQDGVLITTITQTLPTVSPTYYLATTCLGTTLVTSFDWFHAYVTGMTR